LYIRYVIKKPIGRGARLAARLNRNSGPKGEALISVAVCELQRAQPLTTVDEAVMGKHSRTFILGDSVLGNF
jgi:hypothetical protein